MQANSDPLASFILQTLKHKIKPTDKDVMDKLTQPKKQKSVWKSPRLEQKASQGKSLLKKAQEVIAKKWGALEE
jgi:hypothetical protein